MRDLASPFLPLALKSPERRCLVPVTDFCEWSGEKGSKREYWFSVPMSYNPLPRSGGRLSRARHTRSPPVRPNSPVAAIQR